MKRIILIVIALAILACSLTGCSYVDNGVVRSKSFTPAHKTMYMHIIRIGNHTHLIPRYISHPDSWRILVENDGDSGWWDVTEDYFDAVNIGDYVDRRAPDKNGPERTGTD